MVMGLPIGIHLARQEQVLRSFAGSEPIEFTGTTIVPRAGKNVATDSKVSLKLFSPAAAEFTPGRTSMNFTPINLIPEAKAAFGNLDDSNVGSPCDGYTEACTPWTDRGYNFTNATHYCPKGRILELTKACGFSAETGQCNEGMGEATVEECGDILKNKFGGAERQGISTLKDDRKYRLTIQETCSNINKPAEGAHAYMGAINIEDIGACTTAPVGTADKSGGCCSTTNDCAFPGNTYNGQSTNGWTCSDTNPNCASGNACKPPSGSTCDNGVKIGDKACSSELNTVTFRVCEAGTPPKYGSVQSCPVGQICKSDSKGVRCELPGGAPVIDPNRRYVFVCQNGKYDRNEYLNASEAKYAHECNPEELVTCSSSKSLNGQACGTAKKSTCYYCDVGNWTPTSTAYTRDECMAHVTDGASGRHYDVSPTAPEWCKPNTSTWFPSTQVLGGECSSVTSQNAISPHTAGGLNADPDISEAYLRSDTFDGRNALYENISDQTKTKLVDKLKSGEMYFYRFGQNRQLFSDPLEKKVVEEYMRSDSPAWAAGRSANYEVIYPTDKTIPAKLFELIQKGDVYIEKPKNPRNIAEGYEILCGKKITSSPPVTATCYYCDGATKKTISTLTAAQCAGYSYVQDANLTCNGPTTVSCYQCAGGVVTTLASQNPWTAATCTAAGGQVTAPTSCPPPAVTTTKFKIAATEAALASAAEQTYNGDGMTIPWDFATPTDLTPRGIRQVWVEFIGSNNSRIHKSAQIEIVGPDLKIASGTTCDLDIAGNGVTIRTTGTNFGTKVGTATIDNTSLEIVSWTDTSTTFHLPASLKAGQVATIKMIRSDGVFDTTTCTSDTTNITLGARAFCRANYACDRKDTELTLVDWPNPTQIIEQKVTVTSQNIIQGFDLSKIQIGKQYRICLKAMYGLRRCQDFTAQKGTNKIDNFVLPLGDIHPSDKGDDVINTGDKAELNRQFGVSATTAKTADFNCDGKVNSVDWACMVYDFNKSSDEKPKVTP